MKDVQCDEVWSYVGKKEAINRFVLSSATLRDLSARPSNRLETLKGDRIGPHSIRINDQYRICFRWHEGNAYDVEIVDYH